MKQKSTELRFFFIKLFSIVFAIVLIINFTINLILDRIPFVEKFSYMDKKQIRNEVSDKIRNEINSALNKDKIFYDEDKELILKLYLKIKKEFTQSRVKSCKGHSNEAIHTTKLTNCHLVEIKSKNIQPGNFFSTAT